MKPEIHPDYHKVIFVDVSTGDEFVTRSTLTSAETRTVDGEEVPVFSLDVSSASHPVWTGKFRAVDTAGRIERFNRRYGRAVTVDEAVAGEAEAEAAPAEAPSSETPSAS